MNAAHFISVSGGKDSTAVMCLARERMALRPDFRPRFVFADTGNEHQATLDHIAYLADALEITIETVRADFSALFEARRAAIRRDWPAERRRRVHQGGCAKGAGCGCPVQVSPAMSCEQIERACEIMRPSGNPFLDLCLLKGRFPGAKTRFCTDDLKLVPMMALKRPLLVAGQSIVEWVGERAQESPARAAKPPLQRVRHGAATQVFYRPILRWDARETFAIAKQHGLRPNPLYLMGMGRVGCWPCIMEKKKGVRIVALRTPEAIDRLAEWERLVGQASRRGEATFFCAKTIPGTGDGRADIRSVVGWASTSRGGRQRDLLLAIEESEIADLGLRCDSEYGLCE